MTNDRLTAPGDLSPKWNINFNSRASLSRPLFQPTIIDDPVGLIGFGDSSALYFAQVTDPGAAAYSKLPTIKAKTYIHGWTANSGRAECGCVDVLVDDTQLFLDNPTGKKLAPYVIAGETIVKVAASAMQIAAIQNEHGKG
jgi:hypothetical protein